jgi:hypothetical protein
MRSGVWYWRRRLPPGQIEPRGTSAGGKRLAICISLGTCDRATARFRGLVLDAEFERAILMLPPSGATDPVDLRRALTLYRDRLLSDHAAARLSRAPDPVLSSPRSTTAKVSGELVERLMAFAEAADEAGFDGPIELPPDLTAEACDEIGKVRARRSPATFNGASERRAQQALANAVRCVLALKVNDLEVASLRLNDMMNVTGLQIPPGSENAARRATLQMLADTHLKIAELERHSATSRGLLEPIPPVRENLSPAVEAEPKSPVAQLAKAAPERRTSGVSVSTAMDLFVRQGRESSKHRASNKVLRDRAVAASLFVELVGDVDVATIDGVMAEAFVESMLRVPAQHGRGPFASLSARASIELADKQDADAATGPKARDRRERQARLTPRLSFATVNKHLSALEGGVRPHLQLKPTENTPFLNARFSRKQVESNPSFARREPPDEMLQKIFQGPRFTGHGDDVTRATPGERLILDARYWVPLCALLSGAGLEELLQLRPKDFATREGIVIFDLGADGASIKTHARPRVIPVHDQLKRLGFLEYVAKLRREGSYLLGPDPRNWSTRAAIFSGTLIPGGGCHEAEALRG